MAYCCGKNLRLSKSSLNITVYSGGGILCNYIMKVGGCVLFVKNKNTTYRAKYISVSDLVSVTKTNLTEDLGITKIIL